MMCVDAKMKMLISPCTKLWIQWFQIYNKDHVLNYKKHIEWSPKKLQKIKRKREGQKCAKLDNKIAKTKTQEIRVERQQERKKTKTTNQN